MTRRYEVSGDALSICFPQLKLIDRPNGIIKLCLIRSFGLLAAVQLGRICLIVIHLIKACRFCKSRDDRTMGLFRYILIS